MEDQLRVEPFSYLFVPAANSEPVQQRRFTGTTDSELTQALSDHFSGASITSGQKDELRKHLLEKGGSTSSEIVDQLIQNSSLGGTGYEIVPVVYPTPASGYIGTSLYIDQVGLFKELPLNDRASRIAQRPIRGDAFLLRCHDNERADVWRRIDCLPEHFEALHSNPPPLAPDPQAQMRLKQLESGEPVEPAAPLAEPATEADVATALAAREAGNEHFKSSELNSAVEEYSKGIAALAGPWHALSDEARAKALELATVCRVNRAACHLRLEQWRQAEADCSWVLQRDPRHEKALYRRATASLHLNEFEAARADLAVVPGLPGADRLLAQIGQRERAFSAKEREKFKGLFA